MLKQVLYFFIALLFSGTQLIAGGFQINMLGMRATSMAGASTGFGPHVSSVFHNPGAMTFQEYAQVSFGVAFTMPSTSYLSPFTNNFDMENKLYTPFHFYASGALNEKLSVGLSINTPFHQRSKWADDWTGRYITIENNIKAVYVQPTISYRLSDQFGAGIGPVVAFGANYMTKDLPITSSTGDIGMELDGKSIGFGFNIGLYFQPNDEFTAGLNYRSAVKMNVNDGDASFSNVPLSLSDQYPASLNFETTYTLPSVITIGASVDLSRELTVGADVNYTTWKSFDSLAVEFKDHSNLNYGIGSFYKNSFAIRIGAQYTISDNIDIRGGIAFDKSPLEDEYVTPINPDADRFMFSLGGTIRFGERIGVDVAYMLQNIKERESVNVETNFGGNYKSLVNIFGFTVNYQFGNY